MSDYKSLMKVLAECTAYWTVGFIGFFCLVRFLDYML